MSRRILLPIIAILLACCAVGLMLNTPARSQGTSTFLRAIITGPAINGVTPFGEVEYWRWLQNGAAKKAAESEMRKVTFRTEPSSRSR